MLFHRLVLATCLVAAPAAAQTGPKASFDCTKARTPVEGAICSADFLAELDVVLDEVYRGVIASSEQAIRQNVDKAQKAWLARRDTACGRAKLDNECLGRLYKARVIELVGTWRVFGNGTGSPITARYAYREKGLSGEMFLAELPDGRTFVQVETVNVGAQSPHVCVFSARIEERRGDVLAHRDPEGSKTCAVQIEVKGNRATLRESPKDCFELAQYWCGARATMLGSYVRR